MRTESVSKADDLTSHIQRQSVREKAKRNLSAFLDTLAEIVSYADDNTEETYRDDGKDGVPLMSIASINEREEKKLKRLQNQPVFVQHVSTDINARGKFGYTQLHQAVVDRDLPKVMELLAKGANTNIKDNGGANARQKAMNRGYHEIVEVLTP